MKRLIGIIFLILAIAIVITYFFLPSSGKLTVNRNIKASNQGIYRSMIDQKLWNRWFSNDIVVKKPLYNSVEVSLLAGDQQIPGNILLVPATADSTKLYWQTEIPNYNRFTGYVVLKDLQHKIKLALDSLEAFTESSENIYGILIQQQTTKDTLLLTARFNTNSYPDPADIYPHINQLRKKVLSMNAHPVGNTMLNVTRTDSSYRCMIAIPVDKILDAPGFVRMIPGRFLTTKIQGGPYTIQHANEMMQLYFKDNQRTSMAIPFEYLITDRSAETDTTKWITEIFAPVY